MSGRLLAFFALLSLLSLPASAQVAAQDPIKVVASFSILGDMIERIGGEDVSVDTLVRPDEDAHDFQPAVRDAKRLSDAEIIAINGLRFEGWMHRLITASGTKAKLLVASAGVRPRVMQEEHEEHGHEHAHHKKGEVPVDPHAWQDPRNGILYIKNITRALMDARPAKAETFKQRAKAYIAELEALDAKARQSFAALPEIERKIITTHDAFGYLGQAYNLTFLAPMGMSSEAQPSATDVAKLIKQIKEEGVQKLFLENMTDPRLIEQIAEDTGAKVGGTLYADALTAPDGDAPTYLDMMKVNIERILQAK